MFQMFSEFSIIISKKKPIDFDSVIVMIVLASLYSDENVVVFENVVTNPHFIARQPLMSHCSPFVISKETSTF